MSIGIPEMNAMSLPVSATRIPTCQSATNPGGLSALSQKGQLQCMRQRRYTNHSIKSAE